jgi:hypothetical protein
MVMIKALLYLMATAMMKFKVSFWGGLAVVGMGMVVIHR